MDTPVFGKNDEFEFHVILNKDTVDVYTNLSHGHIKKKLGNVICKHNSHRVNDDSNQTFVQTYISIFRDKVFENNGRINIVREMDYITCFRVTSTMNTELHPPSKIPGIKRQSDQ